MLVVSIIKITMAPQIRGRIKDRRVFCHEILCITIIPVTRKTMKVIILRGKPINGIMRNILAEAAYEITAIVPLNPRLAPFRIIRERFRMIAITISENAVWAGIRRKSKTNRSISFENKPEPAGMAF